MALLFRDGASAIRAHRDGPFDPQLVPKPFDIDRCPLRASGFHQRSTEADLPSSAVRLVHSQTGKLLSTDEPWRNMFWEKLHARIVCVLQELQAQEEETHPSLSRACNATEGCNVFSPCAAVFRACHQAEQRLEDSFNKFESKANAFSEKAVEAFSNLQLPHCKRNGTSEVYGATSPQSAGSYGELDAPGDPSDAHHSLRSISSELVHARTEEDTKHMEHIKNDVVEHLTRASSFRKQARSYLRGKARDDRSFFKADSCLSRIVESFFFTATSATLIVMNAVFIGYQSEIGFQHAAKIPPAQDPSWFSTGNSLFFWFFLLELLVRLVAQRLDFFIGPLWQWNMFDLLLVMTSAAELVFDSLNLVFFRTLRVLRTVRTLRIIRVFRFFRELRLMASAILHTLSSLGWALVLLLLIMYLFSIVFMQAAISYISNSPDETVRGELIQWFQSVSTSMFSLFRGISGGQDWYELQKPLSEVSLVYSFLLAAYIFFVVFGVLNVLVSVFVERASESSKLDRDLATQAEEKATSSFACEMRDVFEEIDVDRRGLISQEQFEIYLRSTKVKAFFKTRNLDAAAYRVFHFNSRKENIDLDEQEFIIRMLRLRGDAKAAEIHVLLQDSRHRFRILQNMLVGLDNKLSGILQHGQT